MTRVSINRRTGVYVLLKDKKVIYVGATKQWTLRLSQHNEIVFDEARLIECSYELLFSTEKRLIRLLKPKYNKQHHLKVMRAPVQEWVFNNQEIIGPAFKSGDHCKIAAKAKIDLGYSHKTTTSDVSWVILRHYCRLKDLEFNWSTRKFKKVKTDQTTIEQ